MTTWIKTLWLNTAHPQITIVVLTESSRLSLKLLSLLLMMHLKKWIHISTGFLFFYRPRRDLASLVCLCLKTTVPVSPACQSPPLVHRTACSSVCVCVLSKLCKQSTNPCCLGSGWSTTEISKPRHLAPRWLSQLDSRPRSARSNTGVGLQSRGPDDGKQYITETTPWSWLVD